MSGWYEISKSSSGQFRFVLKAANAETLLTSELYTTRSGADGGIAEALDARVLLAEADAARQQHDRGAQLQTAEIEL